MTHGALAPFTFISTVGIEETEVATATVHSYHDNDEGKIKNNNQNNQRATRKRKKRSRHERNNGR